MINTSILDDINYWDIFNLIYYIYYIGWCHTHHTFGAFRFVMGVGPNHPVMDDHDAYCSKWAYIPITNSLTHWLKTCSWFIHRGHEPLNGIQVGKVPNFADTAFLVKCLGSFLSNTKAPLQKQHLMILRRLIFRCVRNFCKNWKFEQFLACNKTWSPQLKQISKGCSTTIAETAQMMHIF